MSAFVGVLMTCAHVCVLTCAHVCGLCVSSLLHPTHRLDASYEAAVKYVGQFPSPLVSLVSLGFVPPARTHARIHVHTCDLLFVHNSKKTHI